MDKIISLSDTISEYRISSEGRHDLIDDLDDLFSLIDLRSFRFENPDHRNIKILSRNSLDNSHTTNWYFDFRGFVYVPPLFLIDSHLRLHLAELIPSRDEDKGYYRFNVFEPSENLNFNTREIHELAREYSLS